MRGALLWASTNPFLSERLPRRPFVRRAVRRFMPGETLEECVHREIEEEAGVRVHNLRYFGSQSHPFPHSLMIGFVADWLDGELRIDPAELADARWFDVDDLPLRPHPRSIAYRLIEDFERRVAAGTESR